MNKSMNRFVFCLLTLIGATLAHGQTVFVATSSGSVAQYNAAGTVVGGFGASDMLNGLCDIGVSGGYLYAMSANSGVIGKYTTEGAVVNATLISGLSSPQTFEVYGGNLYVATYMGGTWGIAVYAPSGSLINGSFITGLPQPRAMAFDSGILYLVNFGGDGAGTVAKYDAATGALVNGSYITGLNYPSSIAIAGSTVFVTDGRNSGAGGIGKYDLNTGVAINASFVTGFSNTEDLEIFGNLLFSLNPSPGDGTLKVYDATTGAVINAAFASSLTSAYGLAVVPEASSFAILLGAAALLVAGGFRCTKR